MLLFCDLLLSEHAYKPTWPIQILPLSKSCIMKLLNSCLFTPSLVLTPQAARSQQSGEARNFFAVDYDKKVAALVHADNSVRWSLSIQAIHDAQELDNGHWLQQTSFGEVNEVDEQGKVVWTFRDFERFGSLLPVAVPAHR